MAKTFSLLSRAACTALVLLAGAHAPALAEEAPKGVNRQSAPASLEAPVAGQLVLAQQLFAIGRARQDALTVLAAARLAQAAAPQPGWKAGRVIRKDTRDAQGKPVAAAPEADAAAAQAGPARPETMFDLAETLAQGDAALLALIRSARAETARGAAGGAQEWPSTLGAGHSDMFEVAFSGGRPAELAILGQGSTNLDLVLADQNGNVICQDVSPSDQIYCDFVPAWDGFFVVTVTNAGQEPASYALITN